MGVRFAQKRYVVAAGVLLAGAVAYLARPTDPAAFAWLDGVGLTSIADSLRGLRAFVHANAHLPVVVRSFFSDAAWAFSLGVILADAPKALLAAGAVVALGHEIAQGLGVVPGTFDVLDLFVLATAFIAAVVLFRPTFRLPRLAGA
jgi:hypothetical protein